MNDRSRNAHKLLLSTRKLTGIQIFFPHNVEAIECIRDQSLALGYRAIKLHAWGDARRDAELIGALREHVGPDIPLMYDGSAGFDLPDAIYVGQALSAAKYLWYEEPMREFSISAYGRLAKTVEVPLLVAETSDGAHMNSADFIAAGAATYGVRAGTTLRGGWSTLKYVNAAASIWNSTKKIRA